MTFWEWLNQQDMHLARWETTGETFEDHDHVLVPLEEEETEALLERYLRNVKKIYGDPVAGEAELRYS